MSPLSDLLVARRIELRLATPSDEPFERRLYASGRTAELAAAGLPPGVHAHLLDMQFTAQSAHHAGNHPQADRWIIVQEMDPVGRMIIDRTPSSWWLLELALKPELQGKGVGSQLIHWLQLGAWSEGATVELHVAIDNVRAESLYRRMGFTDRPSTSATHRHLASSSLN